MKAPWPLALVLAASPVMALPVVIDTLSDEAIAAYAARGFDKQVMMNRQEKLGVHHGAVVMADFPCSDVCPNNTARIIHYLVSSERECAAVGGVEQTKLVPSGIESVPTRFCVPKVLADRGL
jgi:hypothetical protein